MESDEDPYKTDEDDSYIPSSSSSDNDGSNTDVTNSVTNDSIPSVSGVSPKRTRKRQKQESTWKVKKRQHLRTHGKEYMCRKKKLHKSKSLVAYPHNCRYKCTDNISEVERQQLFNAFYDLPTYDHQTSFLSSCIKKVSVAKRKTNRNISKEFTTQIFLLQKRVCKPYFLKTFDISNKRFSFVCKKTSNLGIVEPDKRGKGPSKKKISEDKKNFVIDHISQFPKYKSHYSRKDNAATRYLDSNLNVQIMYNLYKEICVEENKTAVKLSYYRYVFNNHFNLRFHKPHTDTCSRCDKYHNIIKHSTDKTQVAGAKVELEIHQRKADGAVASKTTDIKRYISCTDTLVLCFDLQQTLATPLITTSKVFYLRQLWTYNFCIYNLLNNQAHMFVWSENIASRGSQAIGSCLLQFIKSLPPTVKKLVAYSDSCGGQNKNKYLCKLFMFLVKATHIEEINHKFLEPGHTYMECDRAFGLIEQAKRKTPQVFIPQHWISVIKSAARSFIVHEMAPEMFVSFDKLDTLINDPKLDVGKQPLRFRQITYFKYVKNSEAFYSFEFKHTLQEEFPFSKWISVLQKGRPSFILENVLCRNIDEIQITTAKWKDLQSLLDYIPPVHHTFYTGLAHGPKKKKNNKKTKKPTSQQLDTATSSTSMAEFESDSECDMEDSAIIDSDYEDT